PKAAAEAARRLGLDGRFPNDASIALGTGEVTLLDLTAAYAGFANGGMRVTPFGIAGAQATGAALPVPRPAPVRAIEYVVMPVRRLSRSTAALARVDRTPAIQISFVRSSSQSRAAPLTRGSRRARTLRW
ncbi:MAG: hypothetical protein ACLGHY_12260, partial [Gammaproteobacteria bacterium]